MKLKFSTRLCYGIGNLGYGTIAQTVSSFIMFFGTSILGVSGTLVGLAIAISTFWDGISDPIIGYMSDNNRNKELGKRIGFLIFGTVGMIIFNILLWTVPITSSETVKFFWLLICLLSLETFCTSFATPYIALGIDLAPGYNEQSKLQGYKTIFFILGMVLPSILMFIFLPSGEGIQGQFDKSGYVNIAYFTSTLCLICGTICVLGTLKYTKNLYNTNLKPKEKVTFKNIINTFFKIFYKFFVTIKKKNFGIIIIGYSVALLSTAFLCSIGLHLFTYSFHFSSTQISILMTGLFVSAIISQFFWIFLSNRIDKQPALKLSLIMILFGIALTSISFVVRVYISTEIMFYIVIFCISICGFGTGALYSLPISMFADIITIEKLETGENNSGIYSGFMTLSYNIANCIALLIIGILLDIVKFDPNQPVQAMSVQNSLGAIVFIGCALSIAVALFVFSKYDIKRADVLKIKLKHKNLLDYGE